MRSETSFDLDGDLIFVEAVVVGPSGQADVRLVLDTGAVLTTLVPRIAESIGYTSADRVARSVIRSAVAEEPGYIIRLVQLSTLGFTVPDVHADVADLGYGWITTSGWTRSSAVSPRLAKPNSSSAAITFAAFSGEHASHTSRSFVYRGMP